MAGKTYKVKRTVYGRLPNGQPDCTPRIEVDLYDGSVRHLLPSEMGGGVERIPMTYEDICATLGFDVGTGFVKVTTAGTITFTLDKPDEIRTLLRVIEKKGFVAAQSLKRMERKL